MAKFLKDRWKSFGYAAAGWQYLVRTQPNTWIYIIITFGVIGMSLWLSLSLQSWAVLVLTISLVWGMEMMNTAVEAVVDLAAAEFHPLAKTAKDVSAGAVFFCAIMAVVIGLLIMGPPLMEKLRIIFSG